MSTCKPGTVLVLLGLVVAGVVLNLHSEERELNGEQEGDLAARQTSIESEVFVIGVDRKEFQGPELLGLQQALFSSFDQVAAVKITQVRDFSHLGHSGVAFVFLVQVSSSHS
jgi:hypothetical protein